MVLKGAVALRNGPYWKALPIGAVLLRHPLQAEHPLAHPLAPARPALRDLPKRAKPNSSPRSLIKTPARASGVLLSSLAIKSLNDLGKERLDVSRLLGAREN